jgi:hypothetical protein
MNIAVLKTPTVILRGALMAAFLLCATTVLCAQENYEIEVYPSELAAPHTLVVEEHTNFTVQGTKPESEEMYPNEHALRNTSEIVYGVNDWFEAAAYVFTYGHSGQGYQFAGMHVRPRFRAPEEWHLPVGLGLSTEFGYARRQFSEDSWNVEIRPIVDKKFGRFYAAYNPVFERSLHGENYDNGFFFSNDAKVSYELTKKVRAGLEYYGSLGSLTGFNDVSEQQHMFIPVVDLEPSHKWEVNFGVGIGATHATNHLIMKAIVARHFDFGHHAQEKD